MRPTGTKSGGGFFVRAGDAGTESGGGLFVRAGDAGTKAGGGFFVRAGDAAGDGPVDDVDDSDGIGEDGGVPSASDAVLMLLLRIVGVGGVVARFVGVGARLQSRRSRQDWQLHASAWPL